MITTTLNRIRAHDPCGIDPRKSPSAGFQKLNAFLGPDHGPNDPITFIQILESSGLYYARWCLRAEPQHAKKYRLFAVRCARLVQHLMDDDRSIAAIDVAEKHAHGLASDEELMTARFAAWDAARDSAGEAPWVAAWVAAWDAAGEAVWHAVWHAARSASGSAPRADIEAEFRKMVIGDE